MRQVVVLLIVRFRPGQRLPGEEVGGGAGVGAQASAPSGFAYSPSGPKAAPPTRTGTPIAWQAVIAACAVGSRVGIELESATAWASVLCRWTIRCGVGICAPR